MKNLYYKFLLPIFTVIIIWFASKEAVAKDSGTYFATLCIVLIIGGGIFSIKIDQDKKK